MSETIICPYCETKVKMTDVDAEDGTCPECGAPLLGSMLFPPPEAEDFEGGEEEGVLVDEEEEAGFLDDEDMDEEDFFGDDDKVR